MNKKQREKLNMQRKLVKTPELKGEERVKFLMNELVKAIQECGHSLHTPIVSEDYASMYIAVHHYGSENAVIYAENGLNGWQIRTKPTFKLLEVDSNGRN